MVSEVVLHSHHLLGATFLSFFQAVLLSYPSLGSVGAYTCLLWWCGGCPCLPSVGGVLLPVVFWVVLLPSLSFVRAAARPFFLSEISVNYLV